VKINKITYHKGNNKRTEVSSCSWSNGSWIYNYPNCIANQCLSPL